jgi:hypothetical protein
MLQRALRRFAGYPERYFGFDLGSHRAELEGWLQRIEAGSLEGLTAADLPRWRFEDRPVLSEAAARSPR